MKIRIMSDLHLDVNERFPLSLPENDRGIFTIIAGDTSGDISLGTQWIRDNCPNGVCVAGNHLVYNDYDNSLQDLKCTLSQEFPKDCTMKFLENDFVEINDIIIVGATLYTDFKLNGTQQFIGMRIADRYLNDFLYGKYDIDGRKIRLSPEHYLEMFEKSLEYIDKICQENPNKKIIVVTHHAPSMKSIAGTYRTSNANCAYASDLDQFILDRPNIKCWVHGHVHDSFNYKIGDCRVIANPRGYVAYGETIHWNPCFYIDTETWETSEDESWFDRVKSEDEKRKQKELDDALDFWTKVSI